MFRCTGKNGLHGKMAINDVAVLFQNHFKFVIASQHEIIYRQARKEEVEVSTITTANIKIGKEDEIQPASKGIPVL
jgi:hypothetical protein